MIQVTFTFSRPLAYRVFGKIKDVCPLYSQLVAGFIRRQVLHRGFFAPGRRMGRFGDVFSGRAAVVRKRSASFRSVAVASKEHPRALLVNGRRF